MRHGFLVAGGLVLAVGGIAVSAGSASAYFWDRANADRVAEGVRVAGIDIGGLNSAAARAKLESVLTRRLERPVRLVYSDYGFVVHPQRAELRVDVSQMVDAAIEASRSGGLAHRVVRDLRGKPLDASIPLEASLSSSRIASFVSGVARILARPARDARIAPKPLATGVRILPSEPGLAVKEPLLERAVAAALLRVDGSRTISIPTRAVHPHIWTSTLPHRYGTLILVSRETFTLRLFKRLRLVKTYRIAVGRAGLETPAGMYEINNKQIDPSWHVPLSPWAGALAGQVIPPGPADPIKARWLGFYNGAGIHGTAETWSLGSAASHGCVRMAIPDVEQLYDLVPLHTPIYVG